MLLTCTCVCRYWTAPGPSATLLQCPRGCRVLVAAVGARGDRGCAAARGPRSPAVLLTPGRPAIERRRRRRRSGSAHTLVIDDDDAHSPHNVLISHRTRAAAVCPPPYLSSVFIVIFLLCLSVAHYSLCRTRSTCDWRRLLLLLLPVLLTGSYWSLTHRL